MNLPTSEIEAIRYFSSEDRCIKFVAEQRWPNGVVCPTCGRVDVSYLKMQRRWQCKSAHPKRQFSVKTGTIFEDSPLGLSKWLPAVWKIVNSKNGVSSYEMAASLQITQKSAWFLNHRIREALKAGSFEKLSGAVEADETYVGGKSHTGKRHDMSNKTAVIGIVEKQKGTGRLRAYATKYVDSTETFRFLNAAVEPGSTLHTDESRIIPPCRAHLQARESQSRSQRVRAWWCERKHHRRGVEPVQAQPPGNVHASERQAPEPLRAGACLPIQYAAEYRCGTVRGVVCGEWEATGVSGVGKQLIDDYGDYRCTYKHLSIILTGEWHQHSMVMQDRSGLTLNDGDR